MYVISQVITYQLRKRCKIMTEDITNQKINFLRGEVIISSCPWIKLSVLRGHLLTDVVSIIFDVTVVF